MEAAPEHKDSQAAVATEVTEKAKRRTFSAAFKKRVLEEADRCTKPGELGAMLRREGLYSSHVAMWRAARRQQGEATGLDPRRRGPKAQPSVGQDKRVIALERKNARLAKDLARARAVIEIQKKVAELLGIELPKSGGEN